ncbi:MAG TPA: hypothetical protein VF576_06460 [Rubricoccaceae bacterium]|jgi:hypothetical protein
MNGRDPRRAEPPRREHCAPSLEPSGSWSRDGGRLRLDSSSDLVRYRPGLPGIVAVPYTSADADLPF